MGPAPKVTSSAWSASGRTTPSRASPTSAASTPTNTGRDACDLVLDLVDGFEVEVGAEPGCQPAGIRHDSSGAPSAVTRAPRRRTRPSRLLVVARCSPHRVGGSTTAALDAASPRKAVTATTLCACSRAARARARSGQSTSGSQSTRTSVAISPVASGAQDADGVPAREVGDAAPGRGEVVAAPVQGDAAGEEAGGEAEVERAVHVGCRQRGQESDVGQRGEERRGVDHRVGRLGDRGPSEDHDDGTVPAFDRVDDRPTGLGAARTPVQGVGEHLDGSARVAGVVAQHRRRVPGEAVLAGRHVEEGDAEVDRGVPDPEVEDGDLGLEVGGEEHDGSRPVQVGDRGPAHTEHDVGGEAVAELGVDVVGAQHPLGEAGPEVGVLVHAAGPAEDGDPARPVGVEGVAQLGGGRVERLGPRRLDDSPARRASGWRSRVSLCTHSSP